MLFFACIDKKTQFDIMFSMSELTLQQEVALLRSAVIGLIAERDPEGEYRPEFIESTFAAITEKPTSRFTTAKEFLARTRKQAIS